MEYDGKDNNYGEIRIIIRNVYKDNSIWFILDGCERGAISNDPPGYYYWSWSPPSMILENILFQVL